MIKQINQIDINLTRLFYRVNTCQKLLGEKEFYNQPNHLVMIRYKCLQKLKPMLSVHSF